MSRRDTSRVCWLGAFAMGLAASRQSPAERVNELVEACAGDRGALAAARRWLADLPIEGDHSVRQVALRLLDDAIAVGEPAIVSLLDLAPAIEPAG